MTTRKTVHKGVSLLSLFALTGGIVMSAPMAAHAEDGYTPDGRYYVDSQIDEFGETVYIIPGRSSSLEPGTSFFEEGGDGTGGGEGPTVSSETLDIKSYFYDSDARVQGSGSTSTEKFISWGRVGTGPAADLRKACSGALAKADQRARNAGVANPTSRVVGIIWGHMKGKPNNIAWRTPGWFYDILNQWRDRGYQNISGETRNVLGKVYNAGVEGIESASGGRGNTKDLYGGPYPNAVCIALNNETEPALTYKLTISTDKAQIFNHGGGTEAVNDMIHVSRSGNVKENLNGKVNLRWKFDGLTRTASKDINFPNSGDTRSPNFKPSDLNPKWKTWPKIGTYSFSVEVPKQGKMAAAVTHNGTFDDPRQTWRVEEPAKPKPSKGIVSPGTKTNLEGKNLANAQAYDARITGEAMGYRSFELKDIILTKNVTIGAKGADDLTKVYVKDEAGNKVPATVRVEETAQGRTVIAKLVLADDANVTGLYTMVVPTFMKANGENFRADDKPGICYVPMADGEASCHEGDPRGVEKVTPKPNKGWVLNTTTGELVSDPNWTNKVGADEKVFVQGSTVWTMVEDILPVKLDQALNKYIIWDQPVGTDQYINWEGAENTAKVTVGGKDYTSSFTFTRDGAKVTATAKDGSPFLAMTKGLTSEVKVHFYHKGVFKNDYDTKGALVQLTNTAGVQWNDEEKPTNTPPIYTWTPKPNKVWILDGGKAVDANDPDWTNKVAADEKVFLEGDRVGAVVNMTLKKDLARDLESLVIVDDWTDAAKYADLSDMSRARVYIDGQDVTDMFDLSNEGTIAKATAKAAWLATTVNIDKDIEIKFALDGEFKNDYETHGALVSMENKGHVEINGNVYPTNKPVIYTWTPDPKKEVLSSMEQDGDLSSIDTLKVMPGQKVEYSIGLDMRIPNDLAREITEFAFEDNYDPKFIPNKSSLVFRDSRTNKVIPKKNYKTTWNSDTHSVVVNFDPEWVKANATSTTEDRWLSVHFSGMVSKDVEDGYTVRNEATQIVNKSRVKTNEVTVSIPPFTPHKEDLDTKGNNIDGKTVVTGDKIVYRLTFDATPSRAELAYDVHKLGMWDDFDEEYLTLTEKDIVVRDAMGNDVTSKFQVVVKDGKAYIVPLFVDRENVNGELIKGVQPADLDAYFQDTVIDPVNDPIIDQSILGQVYQIYLTATVKKATDGYTIVNKAFENFENRIRATEVVSNPLKDINPAKDVNVLHDKVSINDQSVKINHAFNYQFKSSIIPANRAYATSSWGIRDKIDTSIDDYTGVWAIYAETDIYDGETLLFKKGDKIDSNELGAGYFDHAWDEEQSTVVLTATEKFRNVLNSRMDIEAGWAAYVQMIRVAPGEVTNVLTEFYNDVDRPSNTVVTRTKVNPKIDLEKYDVPSGEVKGDRDTAAEALVVPEGKAAIAFKITNTGDVDLVGLNFSDATVEGTGVVKNIKFSDEFLKNPVLKVGETIYAYGELQGVEKGTSHKNTAKVIAYPKYAKTCPPGTVANPNAGNGTGDNTTDGGNTDNGNGDNGNTNGSSSKDCLPVCDQNATPSVDGSNPNNCVKVCEPKGQTPEGATPGNEGETPSGEGDQGQSEGEQPNDGNCVPPSTVEVCDADGALIPGALPEGARPDVNGGTYGSPCKPSRVEVCPATDLAGVKPEDGKVVEGDKTKFCAEPVTDQDDFHAKRPAPPVLAKTGATFASLLLASLAAAGMGGVVVGRRRQD